VECGDPREMADLDDGAVVAGHLAGAAILVNALAGQPPGRGIAAIVLIAAPFAGAGGWLSDEFGLPGDLRREAATRCGGACVPRTAG
jgi:hypothetical protein